LNVSSYAQRSVAQGKVVVTASQPFESSFEQENLPRLTGMLGSLPECVRLNWEREYMTGSSGMSQADGARCLDLLRKAEAELVGANSKPLQDRLLHLCGAERILNPVPYPGPNVEVYRPDWWFGCYIQLHSALAILTGISVPLRVEFEAQPGAVYFVRWSAKSSGKLELVDSTTGAKELNGLQVAKR
jgi:hypothetical protein